MIHCNIDKCVLFQCADKLIDACGAACPSATCSPSRSGYSFATTQISFVPLVGFEECIKEAANRDAPLPLSEDKYAKCIGGKKN